MSSVMQFDDIKIIKNDLKDSSANERIMGVKMHQMQESLSVDQIFTVK